MNCWVAVGLGHPISVLLPFIDTLTTKLSESALLHLVQIYHLSSSAHSRIFILSCQLMSNKQCSSDPQPTWLLKANAYILSSFLCQLFNSCLEHGTVPSSFKSGYVMPLLKKADLDAADAKSLLSRPITNLSLVSKLLERLVAQQLTTYLTNNGLLPDLQCPSLD